MTSSIARFPLCSLSFQMSHGLLQPFWRCGGILFWQAGASGRGTKGMEGIRRKKSVILDIRGTNGYKLHILFRLSSPPITINPRISSVSESNLFIYLNAVAEKSSCSAELSSRIRTVFYT
jgi:hypothetical protein